MRQIISFNDSWFFSKDNKNFEKVILPHTWNAIDGADGDSFYYRALCFYKKEFELNENLTNKEVYLSFNGANQVADVYLNGSHVTHHEGGYSTFRCNITKYLTRNNILEVNVTNELSDRVYPQQADFTFYGGLYRDVELIIVDKTHFDLDYCGGKGIMITPILNNNQAKVDVTCYVTNGEDNEVIFETNGEKKVSIVKNGVASTTFVIDNPHLWDGILDPYMYSLTAKLADDELNINYGIREYKFDPDKGFSLNGRKYLLRGVARHQDKEGKGAALNKDDHEEDIKLILEMGCSAIRLAHYQHDQYFYDLCDKYGLIVWAEIPYISAHLPNANENTMSQMKELIIQNYNHPSVICWGLSNEICLRNDEDDNRLQNHIRLNELCHELDKTRPTTMAHIGAFSYDINKLFTVPDIHGTNLYYGWYEKTVADAGEYFDSRHKKHPTKCLSISEYGADCNPKFCSLGKERGDYTENYQCYYHEKMLEMIESRDYFWGSFVWNMFDFGSDVRNEGDKKGQNQKGLVTFDRKYKKDAFYMYKAHWNKEPMIHIANKHYIDRVEETTSIIVYSNLNELALYVDDKLIETKQGMYKYEFSFNISSKHLVEVKGANLLDSTIINKVDTPNESYHLDNRTIINWLGFIDKERPGYYSLDSMVSDLLANEETKKYLVNKLAKLGIVEAALYKMSFIPIKFVLRTAKNLTPEIFNDFAEGLMEYKIK